MEQASQANYEIQFLARQIAQLSVDNAGAQAVIVQQTEKITELEKELEQLRKEQIEEMDSE